MLLYKALLLAVSILLLLVSFPGAGLPLLSCIAVAPALMASAKLKPLQSGLVIGGWAWIWWLGALWWASASLSTFSESSPFFSIFVTIFVCFTLAIPYALSAFIIAYFKLWYSPFRLIQIPLCFAVFISAFTTLLPASPVNALFEYPILLQWADVGGLPLLVGMYFIFNTAIASIFVDSKKALPSAMLTLLLTPCLVLSYGYYKLSVEQTPTTHSLTMGYIQPLATNQDQLSALIAQTHALKQATDPVDIIIWPEVPVDFSWHDKPYERYRISALAQELNAHLIILSGYHYANHKNAKDGHFNSANFISNKGHSLAEYRKQKLVPFFEYLPFKKYLAPYFPGARNYHAGHAPVSFHYQDHTLAPLICYEALFTDLVRPYIDTGADIIINPGNDGWFGEAGALSHLSLALLRTIEYRIPLIRVNNSGVSTVINNKGEILFDTLSPLNKQTSKAFRLDIPEKQPTIYYQYGHILHLLGVIILVLSLLYCRTNLFKSVLFSPAQSHKRQPPL